VHIIKLTKELEPTTLKRTGDFTACTQTGWLSRCRRMRLSSSALRYGTLARTTEWTISGRFGRNCRTSAAGHLPNLYLADRPEIVKPN
jgi:hypothetical protein